MSKHNRNRKSQIETNSFSRVFWTRIPTRIKKCEKRNAGEKQRRGCNLRAVQNDVRTHADNLALGNTDPPQQQAYQVHDDISTPGGRWASDAGGGASHVDAPGSNFKIMLRMNFLNNLQSSSPWVVRQETNARERRGCCCGSPVGYLRGICCAAVLPCSLWVVCCVRQS